MSSSPDVLVKVKEGYDGPTPSGNAAAALVLLRLSEFTGRRDFREKAEKTLKAFGEEMESSAVSHSYMLCALDFWFGSKEVVVAGPMGEQGMQDMVREIQRHFLPNKVLALAADNVPETFSLTDGKVEIGGKPTVYICENFVCKSPIAELESLKKQLEA
jgi:uncharacterized protein YyaL (SSP411 family)